MNGIVTRAMRRLSRALAAPVPAPVPEPSPPPRVPPGPTGALDLAAGSRIGGWAWDPAAPERALDVTVLWDGQPLATAVAGLPRTDLAGLGLGTGRYGFDIGLPAEPMRRARAAGGRLVVAVAATGTPIGTVDLAERLPDAGPARDLFETKLAAVRARLVAPAGAPPAGARPGRVDPRLVGTPGTADPLFPYLRHVLAMHGLTGHFRPEERPADRDHVLRWYVDTYQGARGRRRAPLAAAALARLNAPVVIGGRRFAPSRAMLWYLADAGLGAALAGLDDPENFADLGYWWVAEEAPRRGVDDCLVPQTLADWLRGVPETWRGDPLPLSRFAAAALRRRAEVVGWGAPIDVGQRVALYGCLLLDAVVEPGLLPMLPQVVIERFLHGTDPLLDRIVAEVGGPPAAAAALTACVAAGGLDVDRRRFRSVDEGGARGESAGLAPPDGPPVDVQIIGPFGKASGVARACRISRDVVAATGRSLSAFDFALDNPQPGEAAIAPPPSAPVRARVNLLHINADLLPTAFAYLPDVFSQAHTIGFFFWELDRPPEAFRLALDLVDEIWVASEYNRACFAAATRKPVVNVGMAVPALAAPPRAAARARLTAATGIGDEAFVVFSAYDSLSFLRRKNPTAAIRAFQEAFPADPDVRFVLKTHNAAALEGTGAEATWTAIVAAAQADPRIRIIDATLPFETLVALLAASDCVLSLHRSEGFGFGMAEAMQLGIPVVCTGHSGNLDFCDEETAWLVGFDPVPVGREDYVHVPDGATWAEPRLTEAVDALRSVRFDEGTRQRRVAAARTRIADQHAIEAIARRYAARLEAILGPARKLGEAGS